MKCPQCGSDNLPGTAFCDNCGASLSNVAPAPGAMPPPMPAPAPIPMQAPAPAFGQPASAGGSVCPQCSTPYMPGAAFCDNCGASLSSAGGGGMQPGFPPPGGGLQPGFPPPGGGVQPGFPPPGGGLQPGFPPPGGGMPATPARLMVNGQTINVPQKAEVIIGRVDVASNSYPDVDLTPYGASPQTGVSRVHAKMTWQGAWMIEDMNSTNGTSVRGQKLMPHQKMQINSGEALTIGTLQLTFYA